MAINMRNVLDLRKDKGGIKVVEKVVFKGRSFRSEILKILLVIAVVLVLTFGISSAVKLDLLNSNKIATARDNFSVIGFVTEIDNDSIVIDSARSTDGSDSTTYNLNLDYLDKLETNDYNPLIIPEIKIGSKVIAQGVTNGSEYFIRRIVYFEDE